MLDSQIGAVASDLTPAVETKSGHFESHASSKKRRTTDSSELPRLIGLSGSISADTAAIYFSFYISFNKLTLALLYSTFDERWGG